MGGLLALLAAVTMGVTYGWQPDGLGGVEYIIQVPPEKLEQLQSTGEITSAIDPEVRGQVTKIVVRVGHGDLPRVSPKQPALEDRAAVDIPTLQSPTVEVLKPDPDENTFRLPGSRGGAADRTKEALQAGANQIADTANDALQRLQQKTIGAPTAPSNRLGNGENSVDRVRSRLNLGANNSQVDNQNALRGNASGQTQRQPERDNKWFNLQAQKNGPSTDPVVGSADNRLGRNFVGPRQPEPTRQSPFRMPSDPATLQDRQDPGGLGSTSTFAKIPNSNANTNSNLRRNSPLLRSASTSSAQSEREARPNLGYAQDRLRLGDRSTQGNQMTQANQRMQLPQDRLQNQQDRLQRSPENLFATKANGAPGMANGQASQAPPWSNSASTNDGLYRQGTMQSSPILASRDASRNIATEQLAQEYDPTLTLAERRLLPPGGYSFDKYGNPIDRHGRILDERGLVVSRDRAYQLTIGRSNPALVSRQPVQAPSFVPTSNVPSYPGMARINPGNPRDVAQPSQSDLGLVRSGSGTARTESGIVGGERASSKKVSSSPQALFNFLLLLSIFGNAYLIFWLKKLREQFYDLVASKRMAASSGISS